MVYEKGVVVMSGELDYFKNLIKNAATESIQILANNYMAKDEDTYKFLKKNYDPSTFDNFSQKFIDRGLDSSKPVNGSFIVGEAGSGKSTFIRQLIKRPGKIISNMKSGRQDENSFIIKLTNSLLVDFNTEVTHVPNTSDNEPYMEVLSNIVLGFLQQKYLTHRLPPPVRNYKLTAILDIQNKLIEAAKEFFGSHNADFILIFDNIDLCSAKFQVVAAEYFVKLIQGLNGNLSKYAVPVCKIRLFMTVREDTFKSWGASPVLRGVYDLIDFCEFPKPNVYSIAENIYNNAVTSIVSREWGKKYHNLPTMEIYLYGGVIHINEQKDLINYITKAVFDVPRRVWFDHMRTEFNDFHNYLSNHNIRRFTLFIMHCIYNGSYTPIDEKQNNPGYHYSRFDYMKMLFTASRLSTEDYVHNNVLYYNELIHPEEGVTGFPIVLNMFETYMFTDVNSDIYYEDVFMLYIRILQYIWLERAKKQGSGDFSIDVKNIINALEPYFKKAPVEKALKILIYTGILVETRFASRNTEEVESWGDIVLEHQGDYALIDFELGQKGNSPLCSGAMHLQFFLVEYEYISFHSHYYVTNSYSALRYSEYNRAKTDYVKLADITLGFDKPLLDDFNRHCRDEYNVVRFITAMQFIIKNNLERYRKKGISISHNDLINPLPMAGVNIADVFQPWSRISENVLRVLKAKKDSAQKKSADDTELSRHGQYFSLEHSASRASCLTKIINSYTKFYEDGIRELKNLRDSKDMPVSQKDRVIELIKQGKTINVIASELSLTVDKIIDLLND